MKMIKQPTIPPMPKRPTFDARDTQYKLPIGTDLISKAQAIDAARDWYEGLICGSFKGLEKRLRALPPAEPKSGRWILDRSGAYCCSECMEPCASYVMMKPRDKFCKMCGSRNEVTT